jgi:hypothetical protein
MSDLRDEIQNVFLRECPFCGKEVYKDDIFDVIYPCGTRWREDDGHRHYISANDPREAMGRVWKMQCTDNHGGCGAEVTGDSLEEVIEKWNRRPEVKPVAYAIFHEGATEAHHHVVSPQTALHYMNAPGYEAVPLVFGELPKENKHDRA